MLTLQPPPNLKSLLVPGIPAVEVVPVYSQTKLWSVLLSLQVNVEVVSLL